MQFLMSVHHSTAADRPFGPYSSQEEMDEALADTGRFNQGLIDAGHFVFAGGLLPASTAKVVDGRGASPVVTDGPYLESTEQLGGFWVIEADDMDAALRLAAEGSHACRGTVEVRAFEGLDEAAS